MSSAFPLEILIFIKKKKHKIGSIEKSAFTDLKE